MISHLTAETDELVGLSGGHTLTTKTDELVSPLVTHLQQKLTN